MATHRTRSERRPLHHVALADGYVDDVLSGRLVVPELVRLACERHRRDLAAGVWRWSPRHAERACVFISLLVHVKGEWARRPLPQRRIRLEPWQCFVVCSLFGWLRDDGTRRYREAYLEVPRKNTKSTLAAGIALYMLCADGEPGAEVYCGATTEDQAWEVFGPLRMMALKTPGLAQRYGLQIGTTKITVQGDLVRCHPIVGQPGDGASPHCAVEDEFHQHQTSASYDAMKTGMGARSQPLLLIPTTAGTDISGPCYDLHEHAVRVLRGQTRTEDLFVAIWCLDADDDWTDFAAWQKANPNYGVSVKPEFLAARHQEAMTRANRQPILLCKHVNVWTRTHSRFINPLEWDACADREQRLHDYIGEPCWIGLDLASKTDIAAMVLLFQRDGLWRIFCKLWLPEATIARPENEHYRAWRAESLLHVTDGEVTDFDVVEDAVREACGLYQVRSVGYDPWQATQMATHLLAEGAPMVEVRAVVKNFSEPLKTFEALIKSRKIRHDGSLPLAWMVGNVVVRYDKKDEIYPTKDAPGAKIDAVVAACMALNRALCDTPQTADVSWL